MARWHVTQGDNQFGIDGGLTELEAMARRGDLGPGDMIQPPGSAEWMYASEVPELKGILDKRGSDDDDAPSSSIAGVGLAIAAGVAGVLLLLIVIGGGAMFVLANQISDGSDELIGEGGLSYSQMIVTAEGSGLRAEAASNASITRSLKKDEILELLAKREQFYRARADGGAEGWIPTSHVIPMYQLGGADVRDEFDPLYNPDRYIEVANARWMQLPAENPTKANELSNITVFEFLMSNGSRYAMTDLVIQATIKDARGQVLEKIEIPVEGLIPADGETMVGTFAAEEPEGKKRKSEPDPNAAPDRVMTVTSFEELAKDDPDLQLRFTAGVEVEMKAVEFTNAEIDIIELRAIPDSAAVKNVRKR